MYKNLSLQRPESELLYSVQRNFQFCSIFKEREHTHVGQKDLYNNLQQFVEQIN